MNSVRVRAWIPQYYNFYPFHIPVMPAQFQERIVMTYWREFRENWRPLLAAALGMWTGFSTTGVVTSIMAPHFIKDLHWTTAAFAQVGAVSILMSLFIPIA